MQKRNPKTRTYSVYVTDIRPSLYKENMDDMVECAQCGEMLPFGETYTSKEVHNHIGLGYGVCEKCYHLEIERRQNSMKSG